MGLLTADRNVCYLQGFSGHGLALTGLAGKLVAESIGGDASRFDTFARLKHRRFPGGRRCACRRWCSGWRITA